MQESHIISIKGVQTTLERLVTEVKPLNDIEWTTHYKLTTALRQVRAIDLDKIGQQHFREESKVPKEQLPLRASAAVQHGEDSLTERPGTIAPPMVTVVHVREILKGLTYPATKDQITLEAAGAKAPEPVMDILNKLPEKEYHAFIDIENEWAKNNMKAMTLQAEIITCVNCGEQFREDQVKFLNQCPGCSLSYKERAPDADADAARARREARLKHMDDAAAEKVNNPVFSLVKPLLAGIEYPVNKVNLIGFIKLHEAPEKLILALNLLADHDYLNEQAVSDECSTIVWKDEAAGAGEAVKGKGRPHGKGK